MDLMEEMAEAITDRDKEKFKELEEEGEEGEELKKRAKELGVDLKDINSLTDDQKKRRDEVVEKMAEAMEKAMSGK